MDQTSPKPIDDLAKNVKLTYYKQDNHALENTFFSLQQAMLGAQAVRGENKYPLKHMGKEKMRREGILDLPLPCPYELHKRSKIFLEENRWIMTKAEDNKKEKAAQEALEKAAKKKEKAEAK